MADVPPAFTRTEATAHYGQLTQRLFLAFIAPLTCFMCCTDMQIYFHGNAGNMGYRLPNAAKFYSDVGVNVLMMDYRGYGVFFMTHDFRVRAHSD